MLDATDVAREAGDTFVVAYEGDRGERGVMRVNPKTHDRAVLVDFMHPPTASGVAERLAAARAERTRRLSDLLARHPERVLRPADARAWLKQALGENYASLAERPLDRLFEGLSPAEHRAVADRLYAALAALAGDATAP